ncbi:GDSL lipase-like [Punica granatum]|uniref:GDSL lipase-like n=1 Tax=Punica granatum TaxID=22663 RepID=A0A6P8BYB6_PUNGR|nr:GDSL lipase-like [Punica granatum]
MASFRMLRFLLLLVLSTTNVLILHPVGTYANSTTNAKQRHKPLFVFGDSAFDPGNNQYLDRMEKGPAYYSPYGQHFFAGATGRHSDGRIVPDFIAQNANLSLIPPCLETGANFTNGVSFASAGAGVFSDLPGVMNLEQQVMKFDEIKEWFVQKFGDVKSRKALKRAVYVFGFGGKEYLSLYFNGHNISKTYQRLYAEMVVRNLTNAVLELYNAGGRKFGFQNVGPLGCLPMLKAKKPELKDACIEELMSMARKHNKILAGTLKRLGEYMPGLKYSIFDHYNSLLDRINNVTNYGFEEGKAACYQNEPEALNWMNWGGNNWMEQYTLCHNSSRYIFFDGMHTTESANSQIAELMWDGPPSTTQPWTLKQLFEL